MTFGNRFDRAGWLAGASSVALMAASALAVPAQAQSGGNLLEEIVVTAQFREQNLQNTPLAITAISGDMLEARSYTQISDVTASAPNVLLQPNPAGGGNGMRAYIRGVGQGDQSPAVDPGVGIYIDDVYFASITGSVFDLVDVDRVEILRGPQGTLSGMNSMGGSVKIFSKKPSGEGGFVEATYGSYDRTDFRGSADFTIVPDQLFMRLSGVTRHQDGYVKRLDYACVHPDDPDVVSGAIPRLNSGSDCELGTLGGQSMAAVKASLRWLATDNLEINLSADATDDNSETQATVLLNSEGLPSFGSYETAPLAYQGITYDNRYVPYGEFRGDTVINDPYVNYANFTSAGYTYKPVDVAGTPGAPNGPFYADPKNAIESWGMAGTVDWQLSDNLSLKSISAYRGYNTESGADNDGSPVVLLQSLSHFKHEQYSQELRLSGFALDGLLDYTVGGIYFHQETSYETREYDPFISPTFDFIQNDTTVNKSWAVFAHGEWHLTDRLSLATGIRFTDMRKNYEYFRYNIDGQTPYLPLNDPTNPLNGTVGVFDDNHVDYRLNLSYQATDDIMTYAQYSTGFKSGGVAPRPYVPEQVVPFGTEELDAYEVGVKSRFLNGMLQMNAAAFYNKYKDYQATPTVCVDINGDPIPGIYGNVLCGEYANVADAKVKGFELEGSVFPLEGLAIDASLSYLDFSFGEPFLETNAVTKGAPAPGIGDWKWSVGAQYNIRLNGKGTLTPRVDVYYTPGYCGNIACDAAASNDSYTLANARLTYTSEDEDWNVSLEVTNLTDEVYYLNKVVTFYSSAQPGAPRRWAITARRNF